MATRWLKKTVLKPSIERNAIRASDAILPTMKIAGNKHNHQRFAERCSNFTAACKRCQPVWLYDLRLDRSCVQRGEGFTAAVDPAMFSMRGNGSNCASSDLEVEADVLDILPALNDAAFRANR